MTRHFAPPADATAIPMLLIDAMRCRHDARDEGQDAMPCLARALAARDCTILAPALDSLFLF